MLATLSDGKINEDSRSETAMVQRWIVVFCWKRNSSSVTDSIGIQHRRARHAHGEELLPLIAFRYGGPDLRLKSNEGRRQSDTFTATQAQLRQRFASFATDSSIQWTHVFCIQSRPEGTALTICIEASQKAPP